jgi:hypothetical protein
MVAAVLAGIITLEVREGAPDQVPVPAQSLKQKAPSPPVPASRSTLMDQDQQYLATILARPLFSPTRRPPNVASRPDHGLGRLSGVIVSPAGNSAIFVGPGGGKPLVLREGARIGQYVLRSIEIGTVRANGPSGELVLHPVFDPNRKPVTPPSPIGLAPAYVGPLPK